MSASACFRERQTGILQALTSPFLPTLREFGYRIGLHKLNARDFGLAQSRPRLVLVGVHKDEPGLFSLPKDGITTTMGESLADVIFPHRGLGDVVYDQWAENWLAKYGSKVSTTVTSSLYKNKGKMKRRWENELGFAIDPKHVGDGPAPLGSIGDPTTLPYLTVDVVRVLQGFPRAWKFEGKADRQFHQIGNAFPPQMSKAVGLAIARALSGRMPNSIDAPPLVPFSESLIGVKGVTPTGSTRFMLNATTIEDVEELRDSYGTKFPDLQKLRAQAKPNMPDAMAATFNQKEVVTKLGVTRKLGRQLINGGLLKPSFKVKQRPGARIIPRYPAEQVTTLLANLRAVANCTDMSELHDLHTSIKRCGCTFIEAINLIRSEKLSKVGWDESEIGLAALRVDPIEMRLLMMRQNSIISDRQSKRSMVGPQPHGSPNRQLLL
ncbi:DNA cytosine methyltransferase [Agrobacterium tumefaciens]|uniref:DNA cytosine methyltransferase n=1 Tax=Agrobacterium tumefaciens TaxID=358 RepID=UPI001AE720D0|nr:DNA cytosine methyltransferase [Agrobacterium tumefaciens]MBP2533729.1 hypothetical protein [Agrobacterium tumefaciens]